MEKRNDYRRRLKERDIEVAHLKKQVEFLRAELRGWHHSEICGLVCRCDEFMKGLDRSSP